MKSPRLGALMAALVSLLSTSPAVGWGTAEHVRFGETIADPFEGAVLMAPLPVHQAENGPSTFGHWVSAPDFARNPVRFLRAEPVAGSHACSQLWAETGLALPHEVIRDVLVDDQTLASDAALAAAGIDLNDYPAMRDCVEGWITNNSHFGDFAAAHFDYYHRLAVRAAIAYRRTRQTACHEAAYTLEAWAQHYLTDATASGHAWNPPGNYGTAFDLMKWSGAPIRMRVHNRLNSVGALAAGEHYGERFWGDHADEKSEGTAAVAFEEGLQWEITMSLARAGLGQVVAAAECGAMPEHLEVLASPMLPSQPFASNDSMCGALWGKEIPAFGHDLLVIAGLWNADVIDGVLACRADEGMLVGDSGDALARRFFADRFAASPSATLLLDTDPEAAIELEDLGCDEGAAPEPREHEVDACGLALCEVPIPVSGDCPSGHVATAGCCFRRVDGPEESGDVRVTPWAEVEARTVALGSVGVVAGGASELLWFVPRSEAPAVERSDFDTIDERVTHLGGEGGAIDACGAEGHFEVFAAHVRFPRREELQRKVLTLAIHELDEGLAVRVDGRAVDAIARADLTDDPSDPDAEVRPLAISLLDVNAPTGPDGTHLLELVHLNDCGDARPLRVSLSLDDKADAASGRGAGEETGGCAVLPGAGSHVWPVLCVTALLVVRRRRSAR